MKWIEFTAFSNDDFSVKSVADKMKLNEYNIPKLLREIDNKETFVE